MVSKKKYDLELGFNIPVFLLGMLLFCVGIIRFRNIVFTTYNQYTNINYSFVILIIFGLFFLILSVGNIVLAINEVKK